VIANEYGKGRAVISGVNLGLAYSSRSLIADDILSEDVANVSTAAKEIVMNLCYGAGIRKNPCSVSEVKVSVIQTEEGDDLVILINSAPQPKNGIIRLDRAYRSAKTVYGTSEAEIQKDALTFSLKSDESAVIRLCK
jgi:hypothetical protein